MYGYREHPSARQPTLYLEPVAGMKIDYSPLESNTGSRPGHRIVAITALCVVGAAMLLSRETVAFLLQLPPATSPLQPLTVIIFVAIGLTLPLPCYYSC